MNGTALLMARLFLGIPFIVWGAMKLRGGSAKLVPALVTLGLPDASLLATLVGACELLGGLAVVLGYPLRLAAVLLGLWCLLTGFIEHKGNVTELLKNATMAGGFFALAAAGGGALSLFHGAAPGLLAGLP